MEYRAREDSQDLINTSDGQWDQWNFRRGREAGGEETRHIFHQNLCLFEPSFGRSISHINLANVGEFGAGEETRQILRQIQC